VIFALFWSSHRSATIATSLQHTFRKTEFATELGFSDMLRSKPGRIDGMSRLTWSENVCSGGGLDASKGRSIDRKFGKLALLSNPILRIDRQKLCFPSF
jgi:hypothetical protein